MWYLGDIFVSAKKSLSGPLFHVYIQVLSGSLLGVYIEVHRADTHESQTSYYILVSAIAFPTILGRRVTLNPVRLAVAESRGLQ